jgi:hypothetical protein
MNQTMKKNPMQNNAFKIHMPFESNQIKRRQLKTPLIAYLNVIDEKKQYEAIEWFGYKSINYIYYHYLATKYNAPFCMDNLSANNLSARFLFFFDELLNEHTIKPWTQIDWTHSIKPLIKCIRKHKNNNKPIVIPISLIFSRTSSHANLLLIRKQTHTIERFDPHGGPIQLMHMESHYNKTNIAIQRFVNTFNSALPANEPKYTLIDAHENTWLCPSGIQYMESESRLPLKTAGFCAAWCLFITELVLCNPTLPTHQIIDSVYLIAQSQPKLNVGDYLRKLITDYVFYLDSVLHKYMLDPAHRSSAKLNKLEDQFYFNPPNYAKLFAPITPNQSITLTLTPVSSKATKSVKSKCKEGKVPEGKGGRCITKKTITTTAKKAKSCKEGKVPEGKGGRCITRKKTT